MFRPLAAHRARLLLVPVLALTAAGAAQVPEHPAGSPKSGDPLGLALAEKARGRDAEAAAAFADLAAAAMADDRASPSTALAAEAEASLALLLHDRQPADPGLPARVLALRQSPLARANPALADQVGIAALEQALAAGRDDAPALAQDLGCLTGFWVLGPFDNERGAAFHRTLPGEGTLDLHASYPGKQRPVSWRRLAAAAPAGEFELGGALRPAEQVACLLAVAIDAEQDGPIALHLGCAGSFQVQLNGAAVGARDVERGFAFDQDAIVLPLAKGPNLLRLKLCHQETGSFTVAARLRALRGGPAPGVRARLEREELERAAAVTGAAAPAEVHADQGARSHVDAAKVTGFDALWLAFLLHRRAADSEAERADRQLAARAAESLPTVAEARLLLASTRVRRVRSAADVDDNERRRDLEGILQLCPEHVEATVELGQLLLSGTGLREQAEHLAQQALRVEPTAAYARLLLAETLRSAGLDELARRELVAAASAAGANRVALRAAATALLADDRPEQAAPLFDRLAAGSGDVNDLLAAADFQLRMGRREPALALLARAIALHPLASRPRLQRAGLAEAGGHFDDALREVAAWLQLCPDDDEALVQQSRLFGEVGNRDGQIEALQNAIECNPNRRDDQRYLEFLRAEITPFYARWQRDGDALRSAPTPDDVVAGNDPLYHLLRQRIVLAHRNGTTSEYLHSVVRVLTDAGARSMARFQLPYFAGEERARLLACTVHKADGTVERPRLRGASVALASLRPGDTVDLEGRVDDLAPGFFGDYFGLEHLLPPPDGSAVHESELVVIAEPGRDYRYQVSGGAPQPVLSTLADGNHVYAFAAHDLPRDNPEVRRPDAQERLPLVRFSTFHDWDQFAAWYWNLIRGQIETTPAMRAKVAELTAGAASDEQRIAAIYRFVTTDVRYEAWEFGVHGYKPYSTAVIYERRHGDCKDKALLLCALLGELGLEARPVLIFADDTRSNDDLTLPQVEHFNHCIAWLPAQRGLAPRFLDGTAIWHPPDVLPAMDQGAKVLVVDAGKARLMDVPWIAPAANGSSEEYDVQLRPDGGAQVTQVRAPRGDAAVELRAALAAEPARRREQVERALVPLFGAVSLGELQASDPLRYDQPLQLTTTFEVTELGQRSGAEWRLPSTFGTDPLLDLATAATRKTPLLLGPPMRDERVVRYRLPAGARIATLPAEVATKAPFGALRVTWTSDGDRLQIARTVEITTPRIEVADYPAFRDFLATLRAADARVVVLQRPKEQR